MKKRIAALFDGMNMYHHARNAFGDRDGRYDPVKLAEAVARLAGYELVATRFYVGVPPSNRHRKLYGYWNARLSAMEQNGVSGSEKLLARIRVVARFDSLSRRVNRC